MSGKLAAESGNTAAEGGAKPHEPGSQGLIDMHMHSTASDGKSTPSGLAAECFHLGVRYAALTDHDTAEGQEEFLAAAKALGMSAITGIELNVEHTQELHILGYAYDPAYKPLSDMLASLKTERLRRAERIVSALCEKGYRIELSRVLELAGGGVVGRPHIAQALTEAGWCSDMNDAFDRFLSKGGPGYVERMRLTSAKAISLIRSAGGAAVLAHPGCMMGEDYPALVSKLKKEGLWGIEAYYSEHSDAQCRYFSRLARDKGLFCTCGTDYHGRGYNEKLPGQEKRGIDKIGSTVKNLFVSC